MVICLEQGANDLMVYPSGNQPTQVVLEKRLLNGCVCLCVRIHKLIKKFLQ